MSESRTSKLIAEIQQAAQLIRSGRRNEALLIYQDVSGRAGTDVGVQLQLGHLCEEFGDIDQAVTHYAAAVDADPGNAAHLATLGIAYLNAHENQLAREVLDRAAEIDADRYDVQHGLGFSYLRQSNYEKAVEHLERAVELRPGDIEMRVNLASAYANLGRHEEALAQAEKAVKIDANNKVAQLTRSQILAQLGDMDAATKVVDQLVRKNPQFGMAYDHLARIRKFTDKDSGLIRKAEKALETGMSPMERYSLLFALGKMHDDCGHYDEAFSYYRQANVLQDRHYDGGRDTKLRKALGKAFTASSIESLAQNGHESAQPVFVVGMPRSGTTLIERIIASHPDGAGAGELESMANLAYEMFPKDDLRRGIRHVQEEFTPETMRRYAEEYLAILRQVDPDAKRIVDKLPGNAHFLGLLKVLFPNATIIHAVRNPLDTCLSCYFQNFEHLRWTNDLEVIGQRYVNYRKAMEYWQKVLPDGSILDVSYEALVGDPETHARRMLDQCGLEWDDAVLDFYRKKSVVRTASVAQTRQPIYKTSRGRWTNYAAHLGPLVAEIAPYLDNEREELEEHGVTVPSSPGLLKRLFR